MHYRAMDRVTPALAVGRGWCAPQVAVASQPSEQRIVGRGPRKLLCGRDPCIHNDQPRRHTLWEIPKELAYRRLATRTKPHASHQPNTHTPNQDHADRSGNDVSAHRTPRPMTVSFTQQCRSPNLAPQASEGRTIYRRDLPLLAA